MKPTSGAVGKVRGRGAERKTIVAIAAEVRGRGPGRIRMAKIPDVSATSLRDSSVITWKRELNFERMVGPGIKV